MARMTNKPEKTWVKMKQDDNIYIDCDPVDITGEAIDITNPGDDSETNPDILNPITQEFNTGMIYDSIGFQAVLGIVVIGIVYSIGEYVFKTFPKSLIDERLSKYD